MILHGIKSQNQLLKLSNAPYCAEIDAEDIMHPERLEKQYQQLIQCDENTVIGTAAYSIDVNSHIVEFKCAISGFPRCCAVYRAII